MTDEQILDTYLDGDARKLSARDRKRLDEIIRKALSAPIEDYDAIALDAVRGEA